MQHILFIKDFNDWRSGMKKIGKIIIASLGLISFFVFFLIAQEVLAKKYFDDGTDIMNGFYCEKTNDIDVLVMGSSHAIAGINPLILYQEDGIAAYDLGASWQPLQITSFWLKEALKTQSPKLIVLECSKIYNPVSEIQMNEMLLNIPVVHFSRDKIQFIYEAAGGLNKDFLTYLFPIFEFKGRWKELSRADFTYAFVEKRDDSKGYYFTEEISDISVDLSGYDIDGEQDIPESNKVYLDEIVKICGDNDIELLLVVTPQRDWTSAQTSAMQKYAEKNRIFYMDYMALRDEIQIDEEEDFMDEWHLNDFGSEKLSKHLSKFIKSQYDLPDRREDDVQNSWDYSLTKWQQGNNMNRDVY